MDNLRLAIFLLVFAIIIDLYIAILSWRRRNIPGGFSLFFLMLAAAEWSTFTLFELLSPAVSVKILFSQMGYIGSLSCPVLFLLLASAYTGDRNWRKHRIVPFLFIIPAITVILAFTNPYHHLIWTSFTPFPGRESIILYGHGIGFWIGVIGYSYLCLVSGTILISRSIFRRKYTYRWQSIAMLAAVTVPWIGNMMYIAKINPFPGIDVSPIAFSLAGIITAISIFRFRFLDLMPVARDALFENMVDSLIVLDPQNRVVDINPAGLRLVGKTYKKCIGTSAIDLLGSQFVPLFELDRQTNHRAEINWVRDQDVILDLTLISIKEKNKKITGRLLVIKDITEKQLVKNELQQANSTLQNQLDTINILHDALREQAIHDPLTGLFNRRFLDDILVLEISQAQRNDKPISLVMLDLDNFKTFNDTYGHFAGDEALKKLAEILKKRTRQGDFACRFGGEEFLVVMPGASLSAALRRTEEWRKEFQDNPIIYEGQPLNNTFSAGVATYPTHAAAVDELIKMADKGLYIAKNAGRNRVASLETTGSSIPQHHTDEIIFE